MADTEVDFDRLFRDHDTRLVSLGLAMCGDRDIARSLAQETMMRAYERLDDVLRHPAPSAWLLRVMRNITIDHLRRSAADPVVRWFELIRSLTPDQRAAATLFYADDLSVATIATTLEISEGTVRSTLSKVRKRMRRELKGGAKS